MMTIEYTNALEAINEKYGALQTQEEDDAHLHLWARQSIS